MTLNMHCSAEDVSKRPRQDVVDRNDSEPLKCSSGYSLYSLQLQLYFVEQKKRGYQYPQIFNVKLLSGASVLEIALKQSLSEHSIEFNNKVGFIFAFGS